MGVPPDDAYLPKERATNVMANAKRRSSTLVLTSPAPRPSSSSAQTKTNDPLWQGNVGHRQMKLYRKNTCDASGNGPLSRPNDDPPGLPLEDDVRQEHHVFGFLFKKGQKDAVNAMLWTGATAMASRHFTAGSSLVALVDLRRAADRPVTDALSTLNWLEQRGSVRVDRDPSIGRQRFRPGLDDSDVGRNPVARPQEEEVADGEVAPVGLCRDAVPHDVEEGLREIEDVVNEGVCAGGSDKVYHFTFASSTGLWSPSRKAEVA